MAIYTDRRKAAEARMKFRRGVTPRDEVRAGMVQYRNDQAEERAELDKADALKAKQEKKVVKEKPKKKQAPVKSGKKVAKKSKPKIREKVKDAPDFEHDFNSED